MTFLRDLPCVIEEHVPLAPYTSLKIGGIADAVVTTAQEETAAAVLLRCRENDVPVTLLGNGTNVLISDEGLRGVVLRLTGGESPVLAEDGVTLSCPAALSLKRLCLFAREHGLSGLEFAFGIPGTVGGAVVMNAGAYDGQMADVLVSAAGIREGVTRVTEGTALELSYRHSVFLHSHETVVSACLRLHRAQRDVIAARMNTYMRRRKENQPLEYPSAGSFFKRPPQQFAGTLIERCGLKGYTVGGAQISEKHAGFVINRGGATAENVRDLAQEVSRRVWDTCGVQLEPEVHYLGFKSL